MIQRVLRWLRCKPDTAPVRHGSPLCDRRWRFIYHHDGAAYLNAKTPEMRHKEAMQYMKDTVDEMRAILGKARVYGPYEWPDGWELEGAAQNTPKVKVK